MECSALTQKNLPLVFEEAVKAVFAKQKSSTSKAAADAIVDNVLRGRKFNVSLYTSDFDALDGIDGFEFKNVKINGHRNLSGNLDVSKLDADGNLIISSSEVITKGSVTITVETVSR